MAESHSSHEQGPLGEAQSQVSSDVARRGPLPDRESAVQEILCEWYEFLGEEASRLGTTIEDLLARDRAYRPADSREFLRICWRVTKRQRRQQSRRREVESIYANMRDAQFSRARERAEQTVLLFEAMEQLDERARELIKRRHEGEAYSDIAFDMGLSVQRAHEHYSRAIKQLRSIVLKQG